MTGMIFGRLLVPLRFIPRRRCRGFLRFRHDVIGRWPTPAEMWAFLGWCWVNRIDRYGRRRDERRVE